MTPATNPKYAACRRDEHKPSAGEIVLNGDYEVTTSCEVCGALLTSERIEWYGVFDESATCDRCDEGTPFCECEDGPHNEED